LTSLRQLSFDPARTLTQLRRKAFEAKESHVIVDVRTYRIKPGKMPKAASKTEPDLSERNWF
jgi:hypothetical protein